MSIRPTFFGIEIARSGLTVSQKGLDVTGHNVANVDTAGYTRQRLVNTAYDPYQSVMQFKPIDRAMVGAGAYVLIHDQIRSKFLDRQFRTEQSLLSDWSIRTQGLTYVEALYEGSDSSSLASGINELFRAFNIETNEANDREQRVNIRNAGSTFAQNVNIMYSRLIEQQDNQDKAVEGIITKINSIAESISDLNLSIYAFEMDGKMVANDLRDKRNLLLDELSALVDIEYEEYAPDPMAPNHTKLRVTIGGATLVDHLTVNTIEGVRTTNPITGENDVLTPTWKTGPYTGKPLVVNGGELRGHLDLRDSNDSSHPGIPYFVEQLNNLVRAIAQEVNNVHREGWTHPSAPSGSVTGIDFFNVGYVDHDSDPNTPDIPDYSTISAKDIRLSDEIIESEYNIASAYIVDENGNPVKPIEMDPNADPDQLVVGNQENMRRIYNLLNKIDIKLFEGTPEEVGIGTFQGYVTGMLLDLGLTLQHSKDRTDTLTTQCLAVDNQRLSISGVSLDEEMTNLIKYQHAYAGASRVITTMDEAIDIIINRMGRVGL